MSSIYGDLTEGERAFLVAVSVFVGGFTFEGARHVSAAAGSDEVPVDDVMADLVRRSVILEAGPPKRYALPDDVRRHALEELQASPKYDQIREKHLDWCRSYAEESLDIGRQLGDDRVIAASLTNLGAVAEVKGDHRSARSLYGEALELWRAIGDSYNAASVLANLAEVALAERDLAGARALASDALEARRLVGDKAGMASVLRLLSTVALKQRDVDAARSFEAQRRQLVDETEGSWLARFRRRLAP